MEKNRSVRLSEEHYQMAVEDAKKLGLNFSTYVRYLLIKANKEKKG